MNSNLIKINSNLIQQNLIQVNSNLIQLNLIQVNSNLFQEIYFILQEFSPNKIPHMRMYQENFH